MLAIMFPHLYEEPVEIIETTPEGNEVEGVLWAGSIMDTSHT